MKSFMLIALAFVVLFYTATSKPIPAHKAADKPKSHDSIEEDMGMELENSMRDWDDGWDDDGDDDDWDDKPKHKYYRRPHYYRPYYYRPFYYPYRPKKKFYVPKKKFGGKKCWGDDCDDDDRRWAAQ